MLLTHLHCIKIAEDACREAPLILQSTTSNLSESAGQSLPAQRQIASVLRRDKLPRSIRT